VWCGAGAIAERPDRGHAACAVLNKQAGWNNPSRGLLGFQALGAHRVSR